MPLKGLVACKHDEDTRKYSLYDSYITFCIHSLHAVSIFKPMYEVKIYMLRKYDHLRMMHLMFICLIICDK